MTQRATNAADDPIGTLRREHRGFAHLIKLDQPEGDPCWELLDAYGSCAELAGYPAGMLTDAEVDARATTVVYTPADDTEWAVAHPVRSWRLDHPVKSAVAVVQLVDDAEITETLDGFLAVCRRDGWTVTENRGEPTA